jgi:pyrophosphatase PpaX
VVILFDLDGTLIDSVELILGAARHAFAVCGTTTATGTPAHEEFAKLIGIPLTSQFRRFTDDDAEIARLIAAYREYQLEHHDRLTRCYDGVADAVTILAEQGYRLGVVTSKSDALAHRALAHVGLDARIETVVGADSSTRHKPDPEPVRLALDRMGVKPEAAAFVGDSPFDVEAGNAAGVVTVAALWGAFARPALEAARPGHMLARAADLPPLIAQLLPLQTIRHVRLSHLVSFSDGADA